MVGFAALARASIGAVENLSNSTKNPRNFGSRSVSSQERTSLRIPSPRNTRVNRFVVFGLLALAVTALLAG
jgi:hypothetical protein